MPVVEESGEETEMCEICYTNEIVAADYEVEAEDLETIEFECEHRYCSECTIEQLKGQIEKADIDKITCLNYECRQLVSTAKLTKILTDRGLEKLLEKYDRFKDKKSLDSDPLVRWCPKAGCETHVKAKDKN